MDNFLISVNQYVWGVPMLVLILGTGIYISFCTGFIQVRLFPRSVKLFFGQLSARPTDDQKTSPFRALCTALAATVGTGNLAGVAGAIAVGGPGAIFWMWVSAFLGMAVKFAEAVLSVRYRSTDASGNARGGPMYSIVNGMGLKWRWLALVYSFFGVVAAFGVGNATQINTLIVSVKGVVESAGVAVGTHWNLLMGIGLAILVGAMLLGGARRIGSIAEKLVPFAGALYIVMGMWVLIVCYRRIPEAFIQIIQGAFRPSAITGGIVGSLIQSVRVGTSRGIFTNEAGMGTAGIAHGSAECAHPVQQGCMGIVEVFIDTFVICTMTALVILCSGVTIPYGKDIGVDLTSQAFSSVYGTWIRVPIALSICAFALATVIGWGLYGGRCAQFLLGDRAWKPFVLIQCATVIVGSLMETGAIWLLAETVNGLMAVPNLICLLYLTPELTRLVKGYHKSVDIFI